MGWLALAGWCATACFFSRGILQWLASERAGRSVAPMSYWWVSLAGAALFGVYSAGRQEWILLAGNLVNASIYGRNLWLGSGKSRSLGDLSARLLILPFLLFVLLVGVAFRPRAQADQDTLWLLCAVLGQSLWSSRFVVQWWASERLHRSHLPRSFWVVSLVGNLLLLSYALHLRDPIFVAGFVLGPFVQARNLYLGRGSSERKGEAHPPSSGEMETHPAP